MYQPESHVDQPLLGQCVWERSCKICRNPKPATVATFTNVSLLIPPQLRRSRKTTTQDLLGGRMPRGTTLWIIDSIMSLQLKHTLQIDQLVSIEIYSHSRPKSYRDHTRQTLATALSTVHVCQTGTFSLKRAV